MKFLMKKGLHNPIIFKNKFVTSEGALVLLSVRHFYNFSYIIMGLVKNVKKLIFV